MISLAGASNASDRICTVFGHGWTAHTGQAKKYTEAFVEPRNFKAIDFPDVKKEDSRNPVSRLIAYLAKTGWDKNVSRSHIHFASGTDLEIMHDYIKMNTMPDQSVVLFGVCRGGSASINYMADYNPKNVKAVVVDSAPANMVEMYHTKFGRLGIPARLSEILFTTLWSGYKKDSLPPVQALEKIENKKLPILLLHSRNDQLFPFASNGLRLYTAFKKQGFENVHLAIPQGRHPFSLRDDKDFYLKAVHRFYKQYGLPYNSLYAKGNIQEYSYDLDKAEQEIQAEKAELQKLIADNQRRISYKACTYGVGALACFLAAKSALNFMHKNIK